MLKTNFLLLSLFGAIPALAQLNQPTEYLGSASNPASLMTALPRNVVLPGTSVATDGWNDLSSFKIPGGGGFPGNTMWGPVASQYDSGMGGDTELRKIENGTGGGPFPSTVSLYFGGFDEAANVYGGALGVKDNSPVNDLASVVFQLQIGEAFGYDFWDESGDNLADFPQLFLNGSETALNASFAHLVVQAFIAEVDMPPGSGELQPLYVNLWAFQWDLRGVTEPITSFDIRFTGVQHATVYGLRVDQSDVFTPVVAPEPSTLLLLGLALGGVAFWMRKKKKAEIL